MRKGSLNQGKIYLLMEETGKYVKIGMTQDDIKRRLCGISTSSPYEIYLIELFESDNVKQEEKELHNLFKHLHHRNEWFRFDYSIIEEFKARAKQPIAPFTYIEEYYMKTNPLSLVSPHKHYQIWVENTFLSA